MLFETSLGWRTIKGNKVAGSNRGEQCGKKIGKKIRDVERRKRWSCGVFMRELSRR